MQLAVLLLAYLAAAVALRRVRAQRLVVGGLGLALLVALAGGLGYYRKAPAAFHLVGPSTLGRNLLVLAFACGWILVPAALLGLAGARSDLERCFRAFALAALVGVVGEAALYGDAGVVHERYGMYAVPIVALGFVLHASRGWPWQRAHAVLATALLTVSAATPMSGWAAAGGNAHSLVLTALLKVEALAGSAGAGSLYAVGVAGALSVAAVACAWRRATYVVVALAVAFCVATSAFATSFDAQNSRNVKAAFLPAGADWITRDATVVAANASRTSLLEQFFWNTHARSLALLPGTQAPDVFAASETRVLASGTLASLSGPVVLDEDGAALVPVAPERWNGTWLSAASPRLRASVAGRYGDGWLAPKGTIAMYGGGTLELDLRTPEPTRLDMAGKSVRIGTSAHVYLCASGSFHYVFSKHGYVGLRPVSARSTFPTWHAGSLCGGRSVRVVQ
jgi:hypothetical protein